MTIYQQYHDLLYTLNKNTFNAPHSLESHLRCFEFMLLEQLGYALNFSGDADTDTLFEPQKNYFLVQNHGFVLSENHLDIRDMSFSGEDLRFIEYTTEGL